jgi:hypothetical protein
VARGLDPRLGQRSAMHPERRLFGLAVRVVCLDDLDDDCCALANQERGNLLRDYNLLAGWCRGCVSPSLVAVSIALPGRIRILKKRAPGMVEP